MTVSDLAAELDAALERVDLLASAVRRLCPLTTDRAYESAGPCSLRSDAPSCPMAGVASGCALGGGR